MLPTPVFWTREFYYSPWGHKELDTTEQLSLSLSFTADITISAGEYVLIYSYNKHASL